MPRVRRKGHMKRDAEAPLSEWSLDELQTELERVETEPAGLNPWQAFKRASDLRGELDRRAGAGRHPAPAGAKSHENAPEHTR
jgi:hypothetical protein